MTKLFNKKTGALSALSATLLLAVIMPSMSSVYADDTTCTGALLAGSAGRGVARYSPEREAERDIGAKVQQAADGGQAWIDSARDVDIPHAVSIAICVEGENHAPIRQGAELDGDAAAVT